VSSRGQERGSRALPSGRLLTTVIELIPDGWQVDATTATAAATAVRRLRDTTDDDSPLR